MMLDHDALHAETFHAVPVYLHELVYLINKSGTSIGL